MYKHKQLSIKDSVKIDLPLLITFYVLATYTLLGLIATFIGINSWDTLSGFRVYGDSFNSFWGSIANFTNSLAFLTLPASFAVSAVILTKKPVSSRPKILIISFFLVSALLLLINHYSV